MAWLRRLVGFGGGGRGGGGSGDGAARCCCGALGGGGRGDGVFELGDDFHAGAGAEQAFGDHAIVGGDLAGNHAEAVVGRADLDRPVLDFVFVADDEHVVADLVDGERAFGDEQAPARCW